MNRTRWVAFATALALIAAACSGGDDETTGTVVPPADTTTPSPNTTEATTTTTEAVTTTSTTTMIAPGELIRMPLTGEVVDDVSEIPDRPALVVKLSNAGPDALPQAGLNSADIVIEEVINDRTSRLAAVFHTNDADPVGPVRSGRAQDVNIILAFQRPLFAWSGGNPSVTRAIEGSDVIDLSMQHSPGYYRRSGRRGPNNVFTSTDVLWAQTTDEAGRPAPIFTYLDPDEEPEGESADRIDLMFDDLSVSWGYDADTQRYFRRQSGALHNTETADGVEQVWADNVVVMLADYGVNTFDGNPDAQTQGSNPVYVFSRGTVREGVWLRFEPSDPIGMFDNLDDQNELDLVPGRTWLEIPRNRDGSVEFD